MGSLGMALSSPPGRKVTSADRILLVRTAYKHGLLFPRERLRDPKIQSLCLGHFELPSRAPHFQITVSVPPCQGA